MLALTSQVASLGPSGPKEPTLHPLGPLGRAQSPGSLSPCVTYGALRYGQSHLTESPWFTSFF